MKFRKSISVILLAAILRSTAACADSGEKPEDTTGSSTSAGDTETATVTETGRESVSDDLPTVDYGGAEFTILDRTKYVYEFTAEEENGDILNDAVHERNRKVEDRFNVKNRYIYDGLRLGQQREAVQQYPQSVDTGRRQRV